MLRDWIVRGGTCRKYDVIPSS